MEDVKTVGVERRWCRGHRGQREAGDDWQKLLQLRRRESNWECEVWKPVSDSLVGLKSTAALNNSFVSVKQTGLWLLDLKHLHWWRRRTVAPRRLPWIQIESGRKAAAWQADGKCFLKRLYWCSHCCLPLLFLGGCFHTTVMRKEADETRRSWQDGSTLGAGTLLRLATLFTCTDWRLDYIRLDEIRLD